MAGWVKVYRDLLDKPIFHNEKLLKVFVWCMLKAYHKECEQLIGRQKVMIKPGQFPTGRHKASQELGMAPSTVWDYLKLLEANNTINITSNNKYSVVTLVNWALYQSETPSSDSKRDSTSDKKPTANGQQMDTNKNVKKGKNEKKVVYAPNVRMTAEEHSKLVSQYGEADTAYMITVLDNYKAASGKTYKEDYRAILSWVVQRLIEDKAKGVYGTPAPRRRGVERV